MKMPNLNLTSLMIGCIHQTEKGGNSTTVQFSRPLDDTEDENAPERFNRARTCKGDMKSFLRKLIDDLRVLWPDIPDPTGSQDSEYGEDEDEDEEMMDEDEDEDEDDENDE